MTIVIDHPTRQGVHLTVEQDWTAPHPQHTHREHAIEDPDYYETLVQAWDEGRVYKVRMHWADGDTDAVDGQYLDEGDLRGDALALARGYWREWKNVR